MSNERKEVFVTFRGRSGEYQGASLTVPFQSYPYNFGLVKTQVSQTFHIPAANLVLFVNGKKCEDGERLDETKLNSRHWWMAPFELEYDATKKAPQKRMMHEPYDLQLFVKTPTGKTETYWMLKSETILDLKLQIEAQLDWRPTSQRLICSGKQLEDDRILGEILKDEATLHLCGRLI